MPSRRRNLFVAIGFLLGALSLCWASITGSVSGVVTDASGALITGAEVVAINTQTGIKASVTTDSKGFFNFPALPVGNYDLEISQTGFRTYHRSGLVVDANAALRADASLTVGTINEKIEVTTDTVHVETENT